MARVMDFVHDDTGSHAVKAAGGRLSAIEDDEDDGLPEVDPGQPGDEPYEDGDEDEPPEDEPEDAPPPEDEPDEEEDEPAPKAAKRRDPLKAEMDRLVAESRRAQELEARLREQERRAQIAELSSVKSHAALRAREYEIVRKELDEAIELGEVARQSDLRDKYHDLRTELAQLGAFIQRQEAEFQKPAAPPAAPPPNPRAVAWAKKQKWWGKDRALTGAAMAIDGQLIEEGINPYTDEYYALLDRRLKPYVARANRTAPARTQAVAGVTTRGPSPKGRAVRLTRDQAEMARRLDVPASEYAKYVNL